MSVKQQHRCSGCSLCCHVLLFSAPAVSEGPSDVPETPSPSGRSRTFQSGLEKLWPSLCPTKLLTRCGSSASLIGPSRTPYQAVRSDNREHVGWLVNWGHGVLEGVQRRASLWQLHSSLVGLFLKKLFSGGHSPPPAPDRGFIQR